MRVLVTGAAGFIGFHTVRRLIADGHQVVGIDNLNDYYDPALKLARLERLQGLAGFSFQKLDVADTSGMAALFEAGRFDRVIHLAAYAGVRHSFEHPEDYVPNNLVGFFNVLDGCRRTKVGHLLYASTSSVYGANQKYPYATSDPVAHPLSFYAATKRANEAMAHSYAHMFGVPSTGLRFFTVYGPWGRPDMALFLFTRKILAGEPIAVFNHGDMERDFTYIDDIVEGVVRLMDTVAAPDPAWDPVVPHQATSSAPWRIYNIGNNSTTRLMDMIALIEKVLDRPAIKDFQPMQIGDVPVTSANVDPLIRDTGYTPGTDLEVGIRNFVEWYLEFYGDPR